MNTLGGRRLFNGCFVSDGVVGKKLFGSVELWLVNTSIFKHGMISHVASNYV